MQQLILAAGKATRLQSQLTNKCFTTISGKTLIDYNLELGSSAGVSDIVIVIGHNGEHIRNYVGDFYKNISVKYVYQQPQLGIAHAVRIAIEKLNMPFFMCLSDELLINPYIADMKTFFENSNADCVCGMVPDHLENIQKAYTMQLSTGNTITRLIEKPSEVFNNFKGTGYCMMSISMLSVLKNLKANEKRNEYEMGDWIQSAINNGMSCFGYKIADMDFNINEPGDIMEATKVVQEIIL